MSLFNTLMDFTYDTTRQILGLPANTQILKPADYSESPAGLKTPHTNVVFYLVEFGNEDINRQIDNITQENVDPQQITQIIKYVRNLTLSWRFYGDDAFEWADTVRIGLFDSGIKSLFEAQGMSLIPDIPQAKFIPEPYGNQWYKRYDLTAKFNQLVTIQSAVPAISGTDILIETEKGVVSTCSVSAQS